MKTQATRSLPLPDLPLWDVMRRKKGYFTFDLELTARCNNDCRHCYINVPAGDKKAEAAELTPVEIDGVAGQAASAGVLWCLITGGEPLLRKDFPEIYVRLRKKGFLVSVFTNATLISPEHIRLFKAYPPHKVEVTVYGVTAPTYEAVTRRKGSFAAFMNGMGLLEEGGFSVVLKAMALRSNVHELAAIAEFARKRSSEPFRYDPMLHFRYDGNPARNREIASERLAPREIAALEREDPERFEALKKGCDVLIRPEFERYRCTHLFHCSTGKRSFVVGPEGRFRLCASLQHPDCTFDLRKGTLAEALRTVPRVRKMKSRRQEFLENCRVCPYVNLCLWCPAHAHLEFGELDRPVPFFCETAHARAGNLIDR